MTNQRSILACLGLLLLAAPVLAGALQENSDRTRKWDVAFQPRYTFEKDLEFDGGATANLEEDFGWGFGLSYNMNEKLSFGLDMGWSSRNYAATIVRATDPDTTRNIGGTLGIGGTIFKATYNIMSRRMTPFVEGGIGWRWVDTGIPAGLPTAGCWWDPWWGYVCVPYQATYGETAFAYRLGGGLRFDAGRSFFMRLGYDVTWVDLSNVNGDRSSHQIRLDFGGMFQ